MKRRSSCAVGLLGMLAAVAGCHREHMYVRNAPPLPPLIAARPATTATARTGTAAPAPATRPVARVAAKETVPDETASTDDLKPTAKGLVLMTEVGMASWYGPQYNHRAAADGSIYDQNAMTAAHLMLPFGTVARVTNLSTGQSVTVKINDRGPYSRGRILDLSLGAAKAIGVYRAGVAKVKIEAYVPAQLSGADPGGLWCVQIGAFVRSDDAIKLKNELLRRYSTAKVIEFEGPTGYWVRITAAVADKTHSTQIAANIRTDDPSVEPYLSRTN